MTGGGYPDGIRRIVDAYAAGRRDDAFDRIPALAAADQLSRTASAGCWPPRR